MLIMTKYIGVMRLNETSFPLYNNDIDDMLRDARILARKFGRRLSKVLIDIYETTESYVSKGLVYRASLDGCVEYARP